MINPAEERKERQLRLLESFSIKKIGIKELKSIAEKELDWLKNQKTIDGQSIAISTFSSNVSAYRVFLAKNLPFRLQGLKEELTHKRNDMIKVLNTLSFPIAAYEVELERINKFPVILKIESKIEAEKTSLGIKDINIEVFLSVFKVPEHIKKYLRQKNKDNILKEISDLKSIDTDKYIKKALFLMSEKNYYSKFTSLVALTGRRTTEIARTASFELIQNESIDLGLKVDLKLNPENTLSFSGQLKTKTSTHADKGLFIPVLYDSSKLIETFIRIRKMKDFEYKTNKKTQGTVSQSINKRIVSNFNGILPDSYLTAKGLRSAYASICIQRFCPKNIDPSIFRGKILGHAEGSDAHQNYQGLVTSSF